MPPHRSRERAEFLQDVLTTALEGGIGYWSAASGYHWSDEFPETAFATVHEIDESTGEYSGEALHIDLDVIAKGLGLIRSDSPVQYLGDRTRAAIRQADRENDCGQLDSGDCDIIVQVALFGKVVYG